MYENQDCLYFIIKIVKYMSYAILIENNTILNLSSMLQHTVYILQTIYL